MKLVNQFLGLTFLLLGAPMAQALSCDFESSERLATKSYFGFYLYDGTRKVDERWFYTRELNSGYDEACVQSIQELEKFEVSGHCRPIWSSVKSNIMREFNTLSTRPQVASCLKRLELLEKGQTATASDDHIVDLRQKLIPYLGITALSVMSDKTVLTVAREKGLR